MNPVLDPHENRVVTSRTARTRAGISPYLLRFLAPAILLVVCTATYVTAQDTPATTPEAPPSEAAANPAETGASAPENPSPETPSTAPAGAPSETPSEFAIDPVKGLPPEYKIKDEWPLPNYDVRKMRSQYTAILSAGKFNSPAEEEILELGIKYRLALMTHLSERNELKTHRFRLMDELRKSQPPFTPNLQVHDRYLQILVQEMPRMFRNNFYVREAAAVILENLNQRDADPAIPSDKPVPYLPAVQLMLDLLGDKTQLPAVKFSPIRGLTRVFNDASVSPQTRFQIVRAFLTELQRSATLPEPYQWRVITALGDIKQIEDGNNRPAVAQQLMRVIVDPTRSWMTRSLAAKTLSQIPLEATQGGVNLELVAIELVRLTKEMGDAQALEPTLPHWKNAFMHLYLAFNPGKEANGRGEGFLEQIARRSSLKKYDAICRDAYRQIVPLINKIIFDSENVDFDKQIQQMEKWLADHPQKTDRIAPSEDPVLTASPANASVPPPSASTR